MITMECHALTDDSLAAMYFCVRGVSLCTAVDGISGDFELGN
jgi:hypothetical protein